MRNVTGSAKSPEMPLVRGLLLGEPDHPEMLLRGLRTAQEERAAQKVVSEVEEKKAQEALLSC